MGNVLYGIDADIDHADKKKKWQEHLRRLSEVSHMFLDAGIILVVTAIELTQDDLEQIKTTVRPDMIETIWLGEDITTDIAYDMHITMLENPEKSAAMVEKMLQDRGIIFKPW